MARMRGNSCAWRLTLPATCPWEPRLAAKGPPAAHREAGPGADVERRLAKDSTTSLSDARNTVRGGSAAGIDRQPPALRRVKSPPKWHAIPLHSGLSARLVSISLAGGVALRSELIHSTDRPIGHPALAGGPLERVSLRRARTPTYRCEGPVATTGARGSSAARHQGKQSPFLRGLSVSLPREAEARLAR